MIVFPALCSAMLRRFLDSPLSIWSICYAILLGAYGVTRILFVHVVWVQPYLLSEYTCTFWLCVCLCFYVWLGVCRWACVDYVLWLLPLNGGWTPMHVPWCVISACYVPSVGLCRGGRYLGFCVCDVHDCSPRSAGGCCCIVQLGSFDVYQCFHVIHCLHEFSLQMSVAIWYSYGRRSYAC